VFERYSVLARQAVFLARKEAGETGATSIDTEHLLTGILTVHPESYLSKLTRPPSRINLSNREAP